MNKIVSIPEEEYQHLLQIAEDFEDIQTIEAHRSRASNGLEESVPSEFVERMIEGVSLLTLWREHRGLSMNKLANISGVNRIQIGEIERGTKTGSVHTLKKLADTLDVTVDDLI